VPRLPAGRDVALVGPGPDRVLRREARGFLGRRQFRHRRHDGHHRTERRRQVHDAQGMPRDRAAPVGRGRRVRPAGRSARGRIAYVPQRASVDWDFPATVLDVVKMGLYRTTGLFGRLTGAHGYPCAGLPRPGRHGRFRGSPDRPALGRPAAARVPRPGAGAGRGSLPAGRAFRRCRRRHGTRHRRCPEVAEGPRARR
jgi:hypothetical protein